MAVVSGAWSSGIAGSGYGGTVAVGVGVSVGVAVAVCVGVAVSVGVYVGVIVGVLVVVGVCVGVGESVGVAVAVLVSVLVGIGVGAGVSVCSGTEGTPGCSCRSSPVTGVNVAEGVALGGRLVGWVGSGRGCTLGRHAGAPALVTSKR